MRLNLCGLFGGRIGGRCAEQDIVAHGKPDRTRLVEQIDTIGHRQRVAPGDIHHRIAHGAAWIIHNGRNAHPDIGLIRRHIQRGLRQSGARGFKAHHRPVRADCRDDVVLLIFGCVGAVCLHLDHLPADELRRPCARFQGHAVGRGIKIDGAALEIRGDKEHVCPLCRRDDQLLILGQLGARIHHDGDIALGPAHCAADVEIHVAANDIGHLLCDGGVCHRLEKPAANPCQQLLLSPDLDRIVDLVLLGLRQQIRVAFAGGQRPKQCFELGVQGAELFSARGAHCRQFCCGAGQNRGLVRGWILKLFGQFQGFQRARIIRIGAQVDFSSSGQHIVEFLRCQQFAPVPVLVVIRQPRILHPGNRIVDLVERRTAGRTAVGIHGAQQLHVAPNPVQQLADGPLIGNLIEIRIDQIARGQRNLHIRRGGNLIDPQIPGDLRQVYVRPSPRCDCVDIACASIDPQLLRGCPDGAICREVDLTPLDQAAARNRKDRAPGCRCRLIRACNHLHTAQPGGRHCIDAHIAQLLLKIDVAPSRGRQRRVRCILQGQLHRAQRR